MFSGFLVVRLPPLNFDEAGRAGFSKMPPKLGNLFYGGLERMPWFDVDEDYYCGLLPKPMLDAMKLIKQENVDFTGINLCYSLETAKALLAYSNRATLRNELIVVRSEQLAEIKGTGASEGSLEIEWVGYDFLVLGQWSLLREGLFAAPSYFARWHEHLNGHGLISDAGVLEAFVHDYNLAAQKRAVEDIPTGGVYGPDAVEIGCVA